MSTGTKMKKLSNIICNCFAGLYCLVQDPAGIMCLLALFIVSGLCWFHRVGDVSFAACCTLIPAVIAMLKHRSFSGSDLDNTLPVPATLPLPPPPDPVTEPPPPDNTAKPVVGSPDAPVA